MERASIPATTPGDRQELVSARSTLIPLAFVILALLALALLPVLMHSRTRDMQSLVIEEISPARRHLAAIQLALAREMSGLRGFLLTGEEAFLEQYVERREAESRYFEQLMPHVQRLGPEVLERAEALRGATERWHASADETQIVQRRVVPPAFIARIPFEESLFVAALAAGARLDQAIDQREDVHRAELRRVEEQQLLLTIALVIVALVAAAVIAWFAWRLRALARRLDRRARDEANFRSLAEALSAATSMDQTLRLVVNSAREYIPTQGAFIEWVQEGRQSVEVLSAAGARVPTPGTRAPLPDSVTGVMAERHDSLITTDMAEIGPVLAPYLGRACDDCTILATHLVSDGEAMGSLVLLRATRDGPFIPNEVLRARSLGDLASLALRRVLLLQEAEQRGRELENVLQSKARLIRGLSHDLKNPLSAVSGYADLLDSGVKGRMSPEQSELLAGVRRGIQSMTRIIDDLLVLAGTEAGQLEIRKEMMDVAEAARDVVAEHRAAAENAGLTLELAAPEPAPRILSDAARVQQILGNLLSNAIKYTPEGGRVTVTIESVDNGDAPDAGRWTALRVSDTGEGIPKEAQERIFEEFFRLGRESTEEPGTGLGLAISRNVARLLGGNITVDSEVGRGSTFTLWLPEDTATQAQPRAAA